MIPPQLALESSDDLAWLSLAGEHQHHHAHDHGHQHMLKDPHIWLSISQREIMLRIIRDWLLLLAEQSDAISQDFVRQRYIDVQAKWMGVKLMLLQSVKKHHGKKVVVDHHAFRYLFADMGLEVVGVVRENHDIKPSLKHLQKVQSTVNRGKVACIVLMPDSDLKLIGKITAQKKPNLVQLDPLLSTSPSLEEIPDRDNLDEIPVFPKIEMMIDQLDKCLSSFAGKG